MKGKWTSATCWKCILLVVVLSCFAGCSAKRVVKTGGDTEFRLQKNATVYVSPAADPVVAGGNATGSGAYVTGIVEQALASRVGRLEKGASAVSLPDALEETRAFRCNYLVRPVISEFNDIYNVASKSQDSFAVRVELYDARSDVLMRSATIQVLGTKVDLVDQDIPVQQVEDPLREATIAMTGAPVKWFPEPAPARKNIHTASHIVVDEPKVVEEHISEEVVPQEASAVSVDVAKPDLKDDSENAEVSETVKLLQEKAQEKPFYALYIASFETMDKLESFTVKLMPRSKKSMVEERNGPDGALEFRYYIGFFETREAAQKMGAKLKKTGKVRSWAVRTLYN